MPVCLQNSSSEHGSFASSTWGIHRSADVVRVQLRRSPRQLLQLDVLRPYGEQLLHRTRGVKLRPPCGSASGSTASRSPTAHRHAFTVAKRTRPLPPPLALPPLRLLLPESQDRL
eukprot:TRINITY_DN4007_c0_g1_i1.p2 TRINITY_DN4007_c0_g1~~TRINITY_DN4007_c0_g1_i1.p2  ORF type:complete len:115 (+),score=5.27 TRINITY_DN4007_c0_g1_i1:285-629(+)